MATPTLAREQKMFAASIKRRTVKIGFADFAGGVTQNFAVGAALPSGAMIIGAEVNVTVAFVGMTAPTALIDDGVVTDTYLPAQRINGVWRVTQSTDSGESNGNGVTGNCTVADSTPLSQATAGEMEITLAFAVIADAVV